MTKDITKIVAALIVAPLLAQDHIGPSDALMLRHVSDEEKEKIRRRHRARVADAAWSSVEAAELVCELADAAAEERGELAKAWVAP